MNEHISPIPSRLYNAAVGGHVAGADQIIDDNENKEQSQINAEVKQSLGNGGSVDVRISSAVIAAKSEIKGNATSACDTLGKAETLISAEKTRAQAAEQTLQEQYNALTQSDIIVGALPASGTKNKIYRVPGTTSYSDYMWNGSSFVKMATYNNAIDDEPTAGSDNLVKSKGIQLAQFQGIKTIVVSDENAAKPTRYLPNPLVKGKVYKVTNIGVASHNLTFYDSNKSSLGSILTNDQFLPGTEHIIYFNIDNAVYVGSYVNDKLWSVKFEEYDYSLITSQQDTQEILGNGKVFRNFVWKIGYIHSNTSAGIFYSDNWAVSFPVFVKKGSVIHLRKSGNTAIAKTDKYGSYYQKLAGNTGSNNNYDYTVTEDMYVSVNRATKVEGNDAWIDMNIPYVTKDEITTLPSYYFENNYIDNKIVDIREAMSTLNGISFGFVTDPHVAKHLPSEVPSSTAGNAGYTFYLFKYIMDRLAIPFVLDGGDIPVVRADGWEEIIGSAIKWHEMMSVVGKERVFHTRGNHDYMGFTALSGNWEECGRYCVPKELYPTIMGDNHIYNVIAPERKMYYYFDVTNTNLRVIVLDDYGDKDTSERIKASCCIGQSQYDWLLNIALNCNNKNIILLSHQTADPELNAGKTDVDTNRSVLHEILKALVNKTHLSYTSTDINGTVTVDKDFTNDTNAFVCHLSGHQHRNAYAKTDNVLSILQTCDCYSGYVPQGNYSDRTPGTITEHAISIFSVDFDNRVIKMTRIGAGEDNEWSY